MSIAFPSDVVTMQQYQDQIENIFKYFMFHIFESIKGHRHVLLLLSKRKEKTKQSSPEDSEMVQLVKDPVAKTHGGEN